jgi:hypothetical protein
VPRRFLGASLLIATALLAAVSHGRNRARAGHRQEPDRLEGVRSVLVLRRDEPLYTEPNLGAARRGAAQRGGRLPVFELERGGGCSGRWFSVGPLAWICEDGAEASEAAPPAEQPRSPSADGLPFDYYFVNRDGTFGYRDLLIAEEGVPEAQLQPGFGVAITREGQKPGGERYGLSTHGFWFPLRDLHRVTAPVFRGAPVDGLLSVAWVRGDKVRLRKTPGAAALGSVLPRQTRLTPLETREHGGKSWLRVGEQEWLLESEVARPTRLPRPVEVREGERWFDVELKSQIVTAYVGDRPVFATLASTGKGPRGTDSATPTGVYRVWVKLLSSDMDNLENLEESASYAIQAVPWVMLRPARHLLAPRVRSRAEPRLREPQSSGRRAALRVCQPAPAERVDGGAAHRLRAGKLGPRQVVLR